MTGNKSDQVKRYIVIALSLVFVTMGYFRFVHPKKAVASKPQTVETAASLKIQIPQVETESREAPARLNLPVNNPLSGVLRDIFSPPASGPAAKDEHTMEQASTEAPPLLTLKGTITGGTDSMALINDQLVRSGDLIDRFRVVRIEKNRVLLASGNEKIELEMVRND